MPRVTQLGNGLTAVPASTLAESPFYSMMPPQGGRREVALALCHSPCFQDPEDPVLGSQSQLLLWMPPVEGAGSAQPHPYIPRKGPWGGCCHWGSGLRSAASTPTQGSESPVPAPWRCSPRSPLRPLEQEEKELTIGDTRALSTGSSSWPYS